MTTAILASADDKAAAERAIADLDAERLKIEREERDVLLDYRGRERPADVEARLERMNEDHVRLSESMSTQRASIERFEAETDREDAEDDKEEQAKDDEADMQAARAGLLGRGAGGGDGVSLADYIQRLVGTEGDSPLKGTQRTVELAFPRPVVGGRNMTLARGHDGEPDGGTIGGRLVGLDSDDGFLPLEAVRPDGPAEKLAIAKTTPGVEHPEYVAPIVNAMWDVARILDVCRIYSMTEGNTLKVTVRKLLGGAAGTTNPWGAVSYEAEASNANTTAITEQDPTYGSISLADFKLARMNYFSFESIRDTTPSDIQANVVDAVGLWLGLGLGHEGAIGAGGSAPNGIATELAKASNNSRRVTIEKATADGDGRLTGDRFPGISSIVQAPHEIPDGYVSMYRGQCAFLTSWVNAAGPRRLIMPNGDFFMERDPSGRTVGSLDGFPLIANPGFATWAQDSKSSMVFGCWPMFAFKLIGGPRIDISWEYRFGNDQLSIRAIQEFDCDVLDENAFHAFDCANTA